MKTPFLIILFFLSQSLILNAQSARTVHVETPGTLASHFSEPDLTTVTQLTLTGSIDSSDFTIIKSFLYLDNLDMSDVSIAENRLPDMALFGINSLQTLLLPGSIKIIGKNAFHNCMNIEVLNIPEGVETLKNAAFFSCRKLQEITLPASIKYIEDMCFFDCSSLSEISLPQALQSIGGSAFFGCSGITSFTVPKSVSYIGPASFNYALNAESITVDPANTYYRSVDGVLFDESLKVLLQYPAAKTDTEYSIPASVENVSDEAFIKNLFLHKVIIPATVKNITYHNFENYDNLTAIEVADCNPYFSDDNGVLLNKSKTWLIKYPISGNAHYIVPVTVTHIGNRAFSYCRKLTSIDLPDQLVYMGNDAFFACSFDHITLPESLKTIKEAAFSNCKLLQTIVIPSAVDSIDRLVFFDCNALTKIILPSTLVYFYADAINGCDNLSEMKMNTSAPPEVKGSEFGFLEANVENCILKVPGESEDSYLNHPIWSIYENLETFDFNITIPNTIMNIGFSEGSTTELNIVSTTEWSIENDQSWLQINPTKGMENAKVQLKASANPLSTTRQANLTVAGLGVDNYFLTVVQEGLSTAVNPVEIKESCINYNAQYNLIIVKEFEGNQLEVFNLQGISIINRTIESNYEEVQLHDFPSAVYMVKVGETTLKIYKK